MTGREPGENPASEEHVSDELFDVRELPAMLPLEHHEVPDESVRPGQSSQRALAAVERECAGGYEANPQAKRHQQRQP